MTLTTSVSPQHICPSAIPPSCDMHEVAAAAASSAGHVLRLLRDGTSDDSILSETCSISAQPGVYAADLAIVAKQVEQFHQLLPSVTPYYAVKCNPDHVLLSFLSLLGVSFDVASSHEMSLIADILPSGSLPSRAIFANPFKAPSELRVARSYGVSLMTVDAVDEVVKVARHYPDARVLLRIAVDDTQSVCPLSSKFGARPDEMPAILAAVKKHDVRLVGVAFHVGSGCRNGGAYALALKRARATFDAAKNAGLPRLEILDIGGGFPGHDGEEGVTFREIADSVRNGIDSMFDDETRVIAEPGRYFAEAAYSLAVQVVQTGDVEGARWCTIGDGVFGSFRDAWLLGVKYEVEVLGGGGGEQEQWTVYGPSREAIDVVAREKMLPSVKEGDWLKFRDMGAYTICLATRQSSVQLYQVVYYYSGWGGEDVVDEDRSRSFKNVVI